MLKVFLSFTYLIPDLKMCINTRPNCIIYTSIYEIDNELCCSICFDCFVIGDMPVRLPCFHNFHKVSFQNMY